jgi:hypothetical protein
MPDPEPEPQVPVRGRGAAAAEPQNRDACQNPRKGIDIPLDDEPAREEKRKARAFRKAQGQDARRARSGDKAQRQISPLPPTALSPCLPSRRPPRWRASRSLAGPPPEISDPPKPKMTKDETRPRRPPPWRGAASAKTDSREYRSRRGSSAQEPRRLGGRQGRDGHEPRAP